MELFRLISYSVSHICLMCYILLFIKWRYPAKKTVGITVVSTLLLIALEVLRYVELSRGLRQFWVVLLQIAVVQATTLYLSEYRDFRGLFTGLTSSNYVLLGNVIARVVHTLGIGITGSTIAGVIIHLMFLGGLICYLRPAYLEIQQANRKEWFGLCMIPSAFYLALLFLMYCLSGDDLLQNMALLGVLLTLYLAYVLLFQMIRNIRTDEIIKKEKELLETNIKTMKRTMEEVWKAERQIAIQNHDRRHMIRTMQTLMAERDYEAIGRLLSLESEAGEFLEGSHYCDNVPVNGSVCYYVAMAQKKQITTHLALDIPETIRVNEWELAIVVGNLLENAIQAAETLEDVKKRELWMKGKLIRGRLLIEVFNTYSGNIEFDKHTSLPISNNGEGHGIGLRSVAYFAECNDGVFDCGVGDDKFFVRLLL